MSWYFINVLDMKFPVNTEYERHLAREVIKKLANPGPFSKSKYSFKADIFSLEKEPEYSYGLFTHSTPEKTKGVFSVSDGGYYYSGPNSEPWE